MTKDGSSDAPYRSEQTCYTKDGKKVKPQNGDVICFAVDIESIIHVIVILNGCNESAV